MTYEAFEDATLRKVFSVALDEEHASAASDPPCVLLSGLAQV